MRKSILRDRPRGNQLTHPNDYSPHPIAVDYAGHVESYICQHDGPLELGSIAEEFRRELWQVRPIQTVEELALWFSRINFHLRAKGVPYEQMTELPPGFKE